MCSDRSCAQTNIKSLSSLVLFLSPIRTHSTADKNVLDDNRGNCAKLYLFVGGVGMVGACT